MVLVHNSSDDPKPQAVVLALFSGAVDRAIGPGCLDCPPIIAVGNPQKEDAPIYTQGKRDPFIAAGRQGLHRVIQKIAQKVNNPNVPLQPNEIAEEIYQCWKIGASVAHVHVRDEEGNDSMKVETFKKVIDTLHGNHPDCNIILNLTAAGGIANSEEARMAPFKTLKPEMASFDCGTMNWMHMGIFNNNPPFLEKMGLAMQEAGVKPEIEVFDLGMIYDAGYYLKKDILKAPLHFQFCMGCAGGVDATIEDLVTMRSTLAKVAPGSTWSAFGVGKGAMEIMYSAIAAGGHIRVGMEDNVMYRKGELAESNMQLIARARRVIEEYGYEIATSDEARQILGLTK